MEKKEKLKQMASATPSGWLKDAENRIKDQAWRTRSAEIALVVLRSLRNQGISQKGLAERMGVSAPHLNKLLKGNENLTLESISKLEAALGIQLVTICQPRKPMPSIAMAWNPVNEASQVFSYIRRSPVQPWGAQLTLSTVSNTGSKA